MKMFLSRHGIHDVRSLLREHEQFEVGTDKAGEWPVPFSSETVRRVVVE